jgi:hypothetical protein
VVATVALDRPAESVESVTITAVETMDSGKMKLHLVTIGHALPELVVDGRKIRGQLYSSLDRCRDGFFHFCFFMQAI